MTVPQPSNIEQCWSSEAGMAGEWGDTAPLPALLQEAPPLEVAGYFLVFILVAALLTGLDIVLVRLAGL